MKFVTGCLVFSFTVLKPAQRKMLFDDRVCKMDPDSQERISDA